MFLKRKILVLVSFLYLAGCAASDQLPGLGSSGNEATFETTADGRRIYAEAEFGSGQIFGDGMDSYFATGTEDEGYVYPKFTFSGVGVLTHRGGSNTVKQSMIGRIERDTFEFETTEYYAISGKHLKDVNKQLKSKVYGKAGIAAGNRAKAADLNARANDGSGFENARVFVYATDMRNTKTGNSYTFSSPIPVSVLPAAMARYQVFAGRPTILYESQVSGSANFTLQTSVSLDLKTDNSVVIRLTNLVVGDSGCKLSGDFPLPYQVVYTIDTDKKIVSSINNTTRYRDDGKCHTSQSLMSVCRADRDGVIEDFNGGCL